MVKRQRAVLISCIIILICTAVVVGTTYALFTDSVSVKNHLKAGSLDIQLKRTALEYRVLDENGYLKTTTVADELDLTSSTAENAFGISSDDVMIAPGSYFTATLELVNNEKNVAFDYSVGINIISGADTPLAEQLEVVISCQNGATIVKRMNELSGGLSVQAGSMTAKDASHSFSVTVRFLNDVEVNTPDTVDPISNNAAKDNTVIFDLVVSAQQATA